jgi:flagellar protein FlaF
MNRMLAARAAYGAPEAPVRTSRAIEYELLSRVTQRLHAAWDGRAADFPALAEAIHHNTRVWTAFAADLAEPGNALPAALRVRLMYLARFSAAHGRRVLRHEAGIEALVEINTAVMRGLRGSGGGE